MAINVADLSVGNFSQESERLFERARAVIPGGVNSPVRAFTQVGGVPRFMVRGEGPYLYDADGKQYLDFVCSWGPLILGHSSPLVSNAIIEALSGGTSFGTPTEREVVFAERLVEILPGVDMIRMVSSGTEATMSAVRLARGFTGRDVVIKTDGCYHGHGDVFLVQAGSGVATQGITGSPGVPRQVSELTLSVEFNDLQLLEDTLKNVGPDRVAAIIVEPVAGNMGLVLPEPGYLEGLRTLCSRFGIVLIFDEVMTGFRLALGGAAERFGVVPDLSTFGKVIGGGLPVGAFGGRREIMQCLAPIGPVYQAGTLSGNPLAMAAGLATLEHLSSKAPYKEFDRLSALFAEGFREIGLRRGVPIQTANCGSMIGFFFSEKPVRNFTDAKAANIPLFKAFFHGMLNAGVYLAPSAFEAGFLSTAHSEQHVMMLLEKAEFVLESL